MKNVLDKIIRLHGLSVLTTSHIYLFSKKKYENKKTNIPPKF